MGNNVLQKYYKLKILSVSKLRTNVSKPKKITDKRFQITEKRFHVFGWIIFGVFYSQIFVRLVLYNITDKRFQITDKRFQITDKRFQITDKITDLKYPAV